jgi:pantoate--beta-alanine ligase
MRTLTTIREVRSWRRDQTGTVGLVPTMGALHAGHLSLVARARDENDHVVATVFVNPTQFGPHEDLDRYPRDLERDRKRLAEAGADVLFAPAAAEMYPAGFETAVEVGSVAAPLEGERRPGHFRGVATVVLKLFNIATPTRAYFGRKDAQQLAVVERLVRDLDLPVELVGCPIVREPDGLAMSSRNAYLLPEERTAAASLHRALRAASEAWRRGERDAGALRGILRDVLASEPRVRIDYVSVADPHTFQERTTAMAPSLLLVAAYVGQTRLIDNERLEG